MTGETLNFAIPTGLKPQRANSVAQGEPETLQELISTAGLGELTKPVTRDSDSTFHAKLDRLMQSWEKTKASATSVQQGAFSGP